MGTNAFEKELAARATKISELQKQVLSARKRLRNLTGSLEKEEADLLGAIDNGLQLGLEFPMDAESENEVLKAKQQAEKEAKDKKAEADKVASGTGG